MSLSIRSAHVVECSGNETVVSFFYRLSGNDVNDHVDSDMLYVQEDWGILGEILCASHE